MFLTKHSLYYLKSYRYNELRSDQGIADGLKNSDGGIYTFLG